MIFHILVALKYLALCMILI
uniref:Uncharacterized protein n=1 Tax=Rhizophora mucronata TaxID=61149 RepID=A0A2P2PHM9_RHIMU